MKYVQKTAAALALSLTALFGTAANAGLIQEKIGAWTMSCDGNDCAAAIGGMVAQDPGIYAKMGVSPEKDGGLNITIRVPHTAQTKAGNIMVWHIDGKQVGTFSPAHGIDTFPRIKECTPDFCTSEMHADKEFADKFLAARDIAVGVRKDEQNSYILKLSVRGLPEAVTKMRAKLAP